MKILLLGATGRTGKHVIEEALKKGHTITAIARDPLKLNKYPVEIFTGTPYDYETVESAIEGCQAVINTLNISRKSDNPWSKLTAPRDLLSRSASNAIQAMVKHGIKRYVALSTYGAGNSWRSTPVVLKLIVLTSNLKYAFRDHGRQEELLKESDLEYTICRAPMLTSEISKSGIISIPGEEGSPAAMKLSRNSAAEFFIKIIESGDYIKETVNLSNRSD